MRKNNFFAFLILFFAFGLEVLNAQTIDMPGLPAGVLTTAPVISTAAAPVWYNIMSSNQSTAARRNRFLTIVNEGRNLTTTYCSTAIPESMQNDKYLWRLEKGPSGADFAYLVNKQSGKMLYCPTTIGNTTNTPVTDSIVGVEWKIGSAYSVNTSSTRYQWHLNFEAATLQKAYLNATDTTLGFKVVIYSGGVQNSSGWFFYEVNATKTVTFDQPQNGTIAVQGTNGTPTLSSVATGGAVLVGTKLTVDLTPAAGCRLQSLTVNGNDVSAQVVSNQYKFFANDNATIAATFSVTTATKAIGSADEVYPNPFKNTLKVANALKDLKICLIDMNGKEVLSTTEPSINTSKVQKGNYILKYQSAEGIKATKVVKE